MKRSAIVEPVARFSSRVAGILCAGLCLLAALATAPALAETTLTYTTASSEHPVIVPQGVTSVHVRLIGGAGGDAEVREGAIEGGWGAEVVATLTVVPGQTLSAVVGAKGADSSCTRNSCGFSGKGGYASEIRSSGGSLVIAGAGGGGGGTQLEEFPGGRGGDAGGAAGEAGESPAAAGGRGGTQTAGGVGGENECIELVSPATSGGKGFGGAGAVCHDFGHFQEGGGGGAGYFGGGGGGANKADGGGGGGGSSFVPAGGTVEVTTTPPEVQISYVQPPNPPAVVTQAASEALDSSATLHGTVNPETSEVTACFFEYGTSEAYGSSAPCSKSPGSGAEPVAVAATVGSLAPATTYHFRVVATNTHGTSHGADRTFTTLLHDPPTVSKVSPEEGPQAGGTSVTITGIEFYEVESVTFGSTPATSFNVNSSESITAVVPAGTGSVAVTVKTPYGTAHGGFTYKPLPEVIEVAPNVGPVAGETSATITGAHFTGATEVTFGGVKATSYTVNSSESITATTPVHPAATVSVAVTTPDGTSTHDASFTYIAAPTITKISPKTGPVTGSTKVTITGTSFTSVSSVKFGAVEASSFKVESATKIVAFAPEGAAGTVDVRVTAVGGTSAITSADHYKFNPMITGLSPNEGPKAGGTTVTITGAGFAIGSTATTIKFGTAKATGVNCASTTICTSVSPAHAAGKVAVSVTVNKAKSATTTADVFMYV